MAKEELMDGGAVVAGASMEGATVTGGLDFFAGLLLFGLLLDESTKAISGTAHS